MVVGGSCKFRPFFLFLSLFIFFNMLKVLQDPFKKRLAVSYLWDWVLVIIMTAAFFAIDQITPFHRMFSLEDKTIMFPYAEKESVPVWMLLVCRMFVYAADIRIYRRVK